MQFELTEGYVIVSAYLDSSSVIPEWSDTAEPLYSEFDTTDGEKVLYLGLYEYYKDCGEDDVADLYGNFVERNSLENYVTASRSAENLPDNVTAVFEALYASEVSTASSAITDPFEDAEDNYIGPFVCSDYVNIWEEYVEFVTTSDFSDTNHCGPTAITNMVLAYGNRYPDLISFDTSESVFYNVAEIGYENGYRSNDGTTYRSTIDEYIVDVFASYDVEATIDKQGTSNYNDISSELAEGTLIYISLINHDTYGNHGVMCYAYTRLISETTGWYKTYLKVADGWYHSGRYIDLASAEDSLFTAVIF